MRSKIKLALCSFVVLGLLLWATPALAVPPIPHAFYGAVTINGTDAPIGTVVSAKINGEDAGSYTTTAVGQYGSLAERSYLAVGNANANDGDTITFFVRGIITDTAAFSSGGGPTEKNLALVITDDSTTGEVEETIPPGQTDVVVDASDIADTTITVDTLAGLGEVTVTVKKYYSNPHPEVTLPASMLPRYIDISVDNPDAVSWPMYVEQTYTDAEVAGLVESSLGMYYYKAGAWHRCSDTGVNTAANYVWANMTQVELSGSPVALGGTTPTPGPSGPSGPGGVPLPPRLTLEVDMWGKVAAGDRTAFGILEDTIEAVSDDEVVSLLIREGTEVLDLDGNAVGRITVEPVEEPPPLPPDAYAINAYDFTPQCTFEPAIELTMVYDEQALPKGFDEAYLVVEYYREDEGWRGLPTVVDTFANSVSAMIGHFTIFAIVAPLSAPELTIASLLVSPSEVDPGESVSITVEVANTGDTPGSRTIELWVEGELEDSQPVTMDPGAVESVTFTVSREESGTYGVAVDGLSGSFTVIEEEEFTWWPVGLGVGLGVLLLIWIAYFGWRWRRR